MARGACLVRSAGPLLDVVQTVRPDRGKFTVIPAAAVIGGALLFWTTLPVSGPLSPLPLPALAASVWIWLAISRRLVNGAVKRRDRAWGITVLAAFALSTLDGYAAFYLTRVEPKAEAFMLQSAGIPTGPDGLRAHLYQEKTPNGEFAKFVDHDQDHALKHGTNCQESASGYCRLPESKRRELKAHLAGELCREEFKHLETLIASGESPQYSGQ